MQRLSEETILIQLVERVAMVHPEPLLLDEATIKTWSPDAFNALKNQKILTKGSPAESVVCPGCEDQCCIPVETIVHPVTGEQSFFVVCDNPYQTSTCRVAIHEDQIHQWSVSVLSIAKAVAASLGMTFSGKWHENRYLFEIGIASGKKRRQMLCLRIDRDLTLIAGSNHLNLIETIQFINNQYVFDPGTIQDLVDKSSASDNRYTPSNAKQEIRKSNTQAMYQAWNKEFKKLAKQYPHLSKNDIARRIAKMDIAEGRSYKTILKNMG